jgi:hypothetical protein
MRRWHHMLFMLASSFGFFFASFFCLSAFCSDLIKNVFTTNVSSWFDCPSCLFVLVSSPSRLSFFVLPSMLSLPAVKLFVVILKEQVSFPSLLYPNAVLSQHHYHKVPSVETLGPFLVIEYVAPILPIVYRLP